MWIFLKSPDRAPRYYGCDSVILLDVLDFSILTGLFYLLIHFSSLTLAVAYTSRQLDCEGSDKLLSIYWGAALL